MIVATMADCRTGRADDQSSTVPLISTAISHFGSLVDWGYESHEEITNLVEGGENVISELDFSNGTMTAEGHSDGKAYDALLAKGSVKDSVGAVFLVETERASEDSSELDVFSKARDS